jgi:hypothetical protein
VEGGLRKWSISLYGSSVGGIWRRKRGLWRWAPLSVGASLENLGKDSYVKEGSRMDVSPYRGPIGEPGKRGGPSTGNFEN